QLIAHKYDLKWFMRELVNSEAYQRGASKQATGADWYAQARIRPLTAEEMTAVLREAAGFDAAVRAEGKQPSAVSLPNRLGELIERQFGDVVDGRGEFQATLTERLFLNNNTELRRLIQRRKGNLLDTLLTADDPWEAKIDRLYLTILNRPPTPEQRQRLLEYVAAEPKNPEAVLEEAIWALLNCSEFRFNH